MPYVSHCKPVPVIARRTRYFPVPAKGWHGSQGGTANLGTWRAGLVSLIRPPSPVSIFFSIKMFLLLYLFNKHGPDTCLGWVLCRVQCENKVLPIFLELALVLPFLAAYHLFLPNPPGSPPHWGHCSATLCFPVSFPVEVWTCTCPA